MLIWFLSGIGSIEALSDHELVYCNVKYLSNWENILRKGRFYPIHKVVSARDIAVALCDNENKTIQALLDYYKSSDKLSHDLFSSSFRFIGINGSACMFSKCNLAILSNPVNSRLNPRFHLGVLSLSYIDLPILSLSKILFSSKLC